jgi:hypothetical protein
MAVYIVRVREREANRDIESTFALIDAVPEVYYYFHCEGEREINLWNQGNDPIATTYIYIL